MEIEEKLVQYRLQKRKEKRQKCFTNLFIYFKNLIIPKFEPYQFINSGQNLEKCDETEINTSNENIPCTSNAPVYIKQPYTSIDYAILVLKVILWLVIWKVFLIIEFGAVYFIISIFAFIWKNLESQRRSKATLSAYSVFNPNFEKIQGTYTAEQFEKELLHKNL